MSTQNIENHLINETSPYLLQHAHNPVEWYPWGEQALNKARQEKKPILLSIGYSACHWCHVMAHESFEDEETARIMNELFINIKVDREERPDIDKIYQIAQQLLTQRNGGWPLTMFLTPEDQLPFFGGTYFPIESRFGLPGFKGLLHKVADFYHSEQEAIKTQNANMQETLHKISESIQSDVDEELDNDPIEAAIIQLQQHFDPVNGGFSQAPKFPHPTSIELLMRSYVGFGKKGKQLEMVTFTLDKMANGGIYDQVGGGFCRYSVDETWTIPHFEKMLYDNGPLLGIYSQCWQMTANDDYKTIALETAGWVIRDMQGAEGGYYSTLDADSEGEEGKFYVWDSQEIKSILSEDEFRLCEKYFGLDKPQNFEGIWHLRIDQPLNKVAEDLCMEIEQAESHLLKIKQKLLSVRNKRIWPGRDEKILTSWNALMIKGMATAAIAFEREDYFASASRALEFIQETLWKNDRLLATCKDSKAHLNAYLDDYAFLIDAILKLLQYRWRTDWLEFAIQLAECLMNNFEDKTQGGFFFTSHDHEKLIQRSKSLMDDALPSGNGVAAQVLTQLGHLLGEQRYLAASEAGLKYSWHSLQQYPSAYNSLLIALDEYLAPPPVIILRGETDSLGEWQRHCYALKNPFLQVYAIAENAGKLPGLLDKRESKQSVTAYICQGHVCQAPLNRLDLLHENLNNL